MSPRPNKAPEPPAAPPRLQAPLRRAWLAPGDWQDYVRLETGPDARLWGRLFVLDGSGGPAEPPVSHWAENTWLAPELVEYASIGDAAKKLRAIQRNWWPYAPALHRRAALIQEALPHIGHKPRGFPFAVPDQAMGAYSLLDEHTMIVSARCTSPFPGGELRFEEDHTNPPSTAYLKMWEALTRLGRHPGPGARCIDAGACPGGWTWVFDSLGAETLALDRSPLAPALMNSPRVRFRSGNAFAVTPETLGEYGWDRVDWLCSDLICYPAKLFEWVRRWYDSGRVGNFVITLKMQGEADWESTRAFAALPGGRVYHGCYNKHELTWVWPAP
jgi:23S rRNA (cytidine2498-2'-O)-methyltransferase